MLIRVGCEIVFNSPEPAPMVLMLYLHPSRAPTIRKAEQLSVQPAVAVAEYIDAYGNRCGRIVAPAGACICALTRSSTIAACPTCKSQTHLSSSCRTCRTMSAVLARQPLLRSRQRAEGRLLDAIRPVSAWLAARASHLRLRPPAHSLRLHAGPRHSDGTQTYRERVGVCRDYTHLAITFCRALNIPARYRTGYLGDIGVPAAAYPMDFSAWFEAFLGGQWYAFDARNNLPRIGRVRWRGAGTRRTSPLRRRSA